MSQQPEEQFEQDDSEQMDVSADNLLDTALLDYVEGLEEPARSDIAQRLETEEHFYAQMSKALNEMAMLIAAAAVLDDEAAFLKRRKLVLFEARTDVPEVQTLRMDYLNNRNEVDLGRLLTDPEKQKRFDVRLESFLQDYKQLHSL